MKGLKQALIAGLLLVSAQNVLAIRKDHQGPNEGIIVNGLGVHIKKVNLICQSGAVIPGQPLHPKEVLEIEENFDKILHLDVTVGNKTYRLSTCFNDGMQNAMNLEDNRHFNKFVISEGQGRGQKYYLKCLDSRRAQVSDDFGN